MSILILVFGFLILLGGGILLVKPGYIFSLITKNQEAISLHIFAVVIRVILGVALIIGASDSKYPGVLLTLGWLVLFAAFILSLMGREKFKNLIKWATQTKASFQKAMGILAIFLGCFLIYVVV